MTFYLSLMGFTMPRIPLRDTVMLPPSPCPTEIRARRANLVPGDGPRRDPRFKVDTTARREAALGGAY